MFHLSTWTATPPCSSYGDNYRHSSRTSLRQFAKTCGTCIMKLYPSFLDQFPSISTISWLKTGHMLHGRCGAPISTPYSIVCGYAWKISNADIPLRMLIFFGNLSSIGATTFEGNVNGFHRLCHSLIRRVEDRMLINNVATLMLFFLRIWYVFALCITSNMRNFFL